MEQYFIPSNILSFNRLEFHFTLRIFEAGIPKFDSFILEFVSISNSQYKIKGIMIYFFLFFISEPKLLAFDMCSCKGLPKGPFRFLRFIYKPGIILDLSLIHI